MQTKLLLGLVFFIMAHPAVFCAELVENKVEQDTINSLFLNEVIISSSSKETNSLKTLPGSVSFITPQMIEGEKVIGVKDLSMSVPNFFIPDYGSKLSTPVYIRGIGERSTGQSIGVYVDNMPYLDKSIFDFDFMDVNRIEVLRGPQGTLYGRNAMGGIINVFTNSPLVSQRTKISLTAGNEGLFRAKLGISELLTENLGISVNAYCDRNDGYLTNQYSGKEADQLQSAGTRLRLDWKINSNWTAQLMGGFDITDQGAFPYGQYKEGNIESPNYNYAGNYARQMATANLNLNYKNESIIFNSASGFQYFDDELNMDNDYRPEDIFTMDQIQYNNSFTQEFTVKSNTSNNYQWLFGIYGFYNNLRTDVTTTMGKEGVETILQPIFDNLAASNPRHPHFIVTNENIPIPGLLKTPSYGGAVFHQSTYDNLFTDGLSVTAGIRLDYEKTKLDYNTGMAINLEGTMMGRPISAPVDTTLIGKESMSFTEILPKIAVKYELDDKRYLYATVSNGYKTGGYNIQMFADVAQSAIMETHTSGPSVSVKDAVSYKPEYSWNYEIGFKGELINDVLVAEIAAFYIDLKDIQITDFVESGQGRRIKNAGKAQNMGFDVNLTARLTNELSFAANYGYTHAVFKDYKSMEVDYKDNYVPFVPQNTLSVSGVYNKLFKNQWIDRLNIQAQYKAAGKIYWTESNDVTQDFYGLLNARIGVNKGALGLTFWANNLLDTEYTAFYFESMGHDLAQQGKPLTFGVDLNLVF